MMKTREWGGGRGTEGGGRRREEEGKEEEEQEMVEEPAEEGEKQPPLPPPWGSSLQHSRFHIKASKPHLQWCPRLQVCLLPWYYLEQLHAGLPFSAGLGLRPAPWTYSKTMNHCSVLPSRPWLSYSLWSALVCCCWLVSSSSTFLSLCLCFSHHIVSTPYNLGLFVFWPIVALLFALNLIPHLLSACAPNAVCHSSCRPAHLFIPYYSHEPAAILFWPVVLHWGWALKVTRQVWLFRTVYSAPSIGLEGRDSFLRKSPWERQLPSPPCPDQCTTGRNGNLGDEHASVWFLSQLWISCDLAQYCLSAAGVEIRTWATNSLYDSSKSLLLSES